MAGRDNQFWALVFIAIIVGVPAAAAVSHSAGWFPNPLGAWVIESLTGTPEPGVIPPGTQMAKVALDVIKRGAEATDPSTTAYIWYDWDGDGLVDLGEYPDYGEIETKAATDGVITTSVKYPVGQEVWFQLHTTSYEVQTVKRVVPTPAGGWDGETALTLSGSASLVELDASITVSVVATGIGGSVAMVTESGDYNYTTYGTSPSIDVLISCGTDDKGIGQAAYSDWSTGKEYHGTFLAIKMVLTEKANIVFGSYDYIGDDGTSQWLVWDISEIIFNDAALDDDGDFHLVFGIDIFGAFDWDEINIYDNVLESNFGQFQFGSADGQETDLDFTA